MDYFDVVKGRRMCRNFKPDPIPEGAVEQILDAARHAPSGANSQPWEFVVITKQETKDKLAEIYVEYGRKSGYVFESTRSAGFRHNMFRKFYPNPPGWRVAPVIIAVCGDLRTYLGTVASAYYFDGDGGPNATYLMNVANATHIICQAAHALGLGASWVSTERPWERRAKELLKVPHELTIHEFVPIGYRVSKPPARYRRELKEIVHYEEYDQSKFRSDEDIVEFVLKLRKKTKPAYSDYWVK
ncbi:MAG: nitroreductase family protein [Deltaproteobacteria bacterium]|nr:MAG: nitroreductase family protein [Deltaproteobacteria bacterium]